MMGLDVRRLVSLLNEKMLKAFSVPKKSTPLITQDSLFPARELGMESSPSFVKRNWFPLPRESTVVMKNSESTPDPLNAMALMPYRSVWN